MKRVLNAGCGPKGMLSIDHLFPPNNCTIVRLDVDTDVQPDICCPITAIEDFDDSYDVVFCSHTLEHVHAHEISVALNEFRRVLKPGGYAWIVVPDLDAAFAHALSHGLFSSMYPHPAADITPFDMIYGHRLFVAQGLEWGHRSGFTAKSLADVMSDVFQDVHTFKSERYNLHSKGVKTA